MDISSEGTDIEYALKRSLVSRNKLAIILKNASGETEYCCVECPAKYTDKEKLEMHLCMHNNQYRFLCGICGTGLKRKEHLDRHTLEHTEVRPHKCPQCSKGFKRKEHLNIHMSIHKGEKDKICTLCNRSFNRKDHLQKHLQTHSKMFTEQNLYPLDEQEMMEMKPEEEYIGIQDEFIQMKEEIVDEDVKPYIADDSYMEYEMECSDPLESSECNESAAEQSGDIRTPDSQNNVRPFMCPVCYKSYKRRDHLKIHSWTHMKKEKVCSGCGKAFHKDVQLAAHMHLCLQVHAQHRAELEAGRFDADDSGEHDPTANNSLLVEMSVPRPRVDQESRPHECPICNRRFKRKQHLKVHANVHRKQESIWCSRCNEGFLSNAQFEQHECGSFGSQRVGEHVLPNFAPSPKKENEYTGEMCVQEMMEESMSELTEYGSSADGEAGEGSEGTEGAADEQNIPVPVRVFVCRFCQKAFKRRDHYKIHLHIHTGVKDFFCPDCGKGFYRKDHLQKHAQTHFKQKPLPKPKKQLPALVPLAMLPKKLGQDVKPEITITAPSNAKLRVPLQMKVAYQVVTRPPAREP